jgi:hypothetical protein
MSELLLKGVLAIVHGGHVEVSFQGIQLLRALCWSKLWHFSLFFGSKSEHRGHLRVTGS